MSGPGLPLDVGPVFDEFDVGPIAGRRITKAQNADGTWSTNAQTALSFSPCVITPANAQDLELVPEADRDREIIRVYTETEIRKTDEVDYAVRGTTRRWRVVRVDDYAQHAGVYRALAVLVDTQVSTVSGALGSGALGVGRLGSFRLGGGA